MLKLKLIAATAVTSVFLAGMALPAWASGSFSGVSRPSISGSARVGQTLTAKPDVVTAPAATSKTYRWYRGSTAISGAKSSTYRLTAADKGKTIKVQVCYRKSSFPTKCVSSAATAKVASGRFTGTVRIVGTALPGKVLTASGSISPTTTASGWEWYDGATKIARGSAYTVTKSQVGHTLYLKGTFKRTGYTTKTFTSSAVKVSSPQTAPMSASVTGWNLPGTTLMVTGLPSDASASYQWLRNGTPIAGATAASYTADDADFATTTAVQVTATAPSRPAFNQTITARQSDAQVIFAAINHARATGYSCGGDKGYFPPATPLHYNRELTANTQAFVAALSARNTWGHSYTDNGKTYSLKDYLTGRFTDQLLWTGDNAAQGHFDGDDSEKGARSLAQAWLASPGHCATAMSAENYFYGFGIVRGSKPEQMVANMSISGPVFWDPAYQGPGAAACTIAGCTIRLNMVFSAYEPRQIDYPLPAAIAAQFDAVLR